MKRFKMQSHNRRASCTLASCLDTSMLLQRSKSKTRPQPLHDKAPPMRLKSPFRDYSNIRPVREERKLRSRSPLVSPSNAGGQRLNVDQKLRELRDKRNDFTEESQKLSLKMASMKRKVKEETKNLQSIRRRQTIQKEKNPMTLASKASKLLINGLLRHKAWAFIKIDEVSQLIARRAIQAEEYRTKKLKRLALKTLHRLASEDPSDLGSTICAREHYRLQLLVVAVESWKKASGITKNCYEERTVLEEIGNLLQNYETNKLNQSFGAEDTSSVKQVLAPNELCENAGKTSSPLHVDTANQSLTKPQVRL